jgi:AcrR family transcriptional regulator
MRNTVPETIRNSVPDNKDWIEMPENTTTRQRRQRVDARRNTGALLDAAKTAFATSGVDVPAKEIAALAGVGVGTLYRHFPRRSDLIVAVLQREIDACAAAGPALSATNEATGALAQWLHRYADFVATKRGLATALHSGDPAFDALPAYFWERLGPVLTDLLDAATSAGEIRADVNAKDLLTAVALLCHPAPDTGPAYSQRMVGLLVDGLRHTEQARRAAPPRLAPAP